MTHSINEKNGLYLRMAYEIKNLTKSGVEEIFYNITKGIISAEEFEGYQWVLSTEDVTKLCLKYDLDIDSDELIDKIVYALKQVDKVTNAINGGGN